MKFKLTRETSCGGWIAMENENGTCDDPFVRVYTNRPYTHTTDPKLRDAVAMMIASPELAEVLVDLRTEVMHDCNASSASAERYADILKRVNAALAKAGAA